MFKKEVEKVLEEKGKTHLLEFAEDIAEVGFEVLKAFVKATDNKYDDMILATMTNFLNDLIDGIDKKEG